MRARRSSIFRGGAGAGYSIDGAASRSPAPISSSSMIARSIPFTAAFTSAPRSNRDEASVFSPSFLLVRRTLFGSKNALSSTMVFVRSLTSDRPPPITPATACAAPVGNDQHVGIECAIGTVERLDALAGRRAANADFSAGDFLEVERVHRLPQLEQHVIGDVDDVVDGPYAAGVQS